LLARCPTPPPVAVDVGAVRGIHQANDSVINVAGKHLALDEARRFDLVQWNAWRLAPGRDGFASWRGHVDPDQSVLLAERVGAHADARGIEVLTLDQRGNRRAHAVWPKLPTVIGTLDRVVREQSPGGKRHAAVRADVPKCERRAAAIAPEGHGFAKQHFT